MPMIDVVIVDDHRLVCHAVTHILMQTEGIRVVGESNNGLGSLSLIQAKRPQVVFLDYFLPDVLGFEAYRQIKAIDPAIKVIFLTAFKDVSLLQRMFDTGVEGIMVKHYASSYSDAVRAVVAGRRYIQPSLSPEMIKQSKTPEKLARLTNREYEVIVMSANGHSSQKIADCMDVAQKTIYNIRSRALNKLGVSTLKHASALLYKSLSSNWQH